MGETGAYRYRKAVRTALILVAAVAVGACEKPTDERRQAAQDARDIAQVEAAQDNRPPVAAVSPQSITVADRDGYGLHGIGCGLIPGAPPAGDPVVVAGPQRALLKLDGRLTMLASDPGSAAMPLGTWTHYVGKERSLTLEKGPGDGANPGSERMRWPGKLTVRDVWNRVIFTIDGTLECGG